MIIDDGLEVIKINTVDTHCSELQIGRSFQDNICAVVQQSWKLL